MKTKTNQDTIDKLFLALSEVRSASAATDTEQRLAAKLAAISDAGVKLLELLPMHYSWSGKEQFPHQAAAAELRRLLGLPRIG